MQITDVPQAYSPELLARSVRDYTRVSELMIGVIDSLMALTGTAGFASSHPLPRAWRDVHFMSMHISLNVETNFAHYARLQLGLGPEPTGRYFLTCERLPLAPNEIKPAAYANVGHDAKTVERDSDGEWRTTVTCSDIGRLHRRL